MIKVLSNMIGALNDYRGQSEAPPATLRAHAPAAPPAPAERRPEDVAALVDDERTGLFLAACKILDIQVPDARLLSRAGEERGFDGYMSEVMLLSRSRSFFAPAELRPRGQIPPERWWPRVALLWWIARHVRDDDPVTVSSLYRDKDHNAEVGGAKDSAHLHCCAIDLHFTSRKAWTFAMRRLHAIYRSPFNFGMGLGVGDKMVHVDFFSPTWTRTGRRERFWKYDTCPADYVGPLSDRGIS